jgi:hypothetical protein
MRLIRIIAAIWRLRVFRYTLRCSTMLARLAMWLEPKDWRR